MTDDRRASAEVGCRRTAHCGELNAERVGEIHTLAGWVDGVRDLGSLVFIDLRDHRGLTQLVVRQEQGKLAYERAKKLRAEFVIAARGEVLARAEEALNLELATGTIEVAVSDLEVLSDAEPPPFVVTDDVKASDELRMQYRYLDLRRPRMQRNLRLRHRVITAFRRHLDDDGFLEVETPTLIRSTPEGARDYLVPSRVHRGQFYALPQSPQILKQILMLSSVDRYYQVVKCFRDEDLRGNRQPEFTQLDMEMSFVEPDDVYAVVESMFAAGFAAVDKAIETPFPRMTYAEAMSRFGVDKPDLRFGCEIGEVSDLVADSEFRVYRDIVGGGGSVCGFAVPGIAQALSRKRVDELNAAAQGLGAKGMLAVRWLADEIKGGPLQKAMTEARFGELLDRLGAAPGSAVLLVADADRTRALTVLGQLRLQIGMAEGLIDRTVYRPLWVTEFPLFGRDEINDRWAALHHPFTAPHPDDIDRLESDPGSVRSLGYDCVLDGEEIGGGSIRIHQRELQSRVFRLLGLGPEEAEQRFGFFLRALQYGAPPHGGIALGLDRVAMAVTGERSIREVIAFPKTTTAQCLLTESPSPVDEAQLRELGLALSTREERS